MRGLSTDHLSTYLPLFVHVVIEWTRGEWGLPTHVKLGTLIARHSQKCSCFCFLLSFFVLNQNQEGGILIVESDLAFFLFKEV
jgi:hypothetical protein